MQRSIQNPLVKALSPEQRELAQWVARMLAEAGQRGWLVGGCVRDLALGSLPKDVDLATGALPEQIEALFPRTIGVGRAFGTIIVVSPLGEVELTTFRKEREYSDGRRPDQVSYGASLEEDAKRRDFSCNALYLDPLTDELQDPEGGMRDLRQGLLTCVGDAAQRFDEDGLRLMRLARFAAGLDLEVQAATLAGARRSASRIKNVSGERKLAELERISWLPAAARALQLLADLDVLPLVLPVREADLMALNKLPASPGPVRLLGTLLGSLAREDPVLALAALDALKPAGTLRRALEEAWTLFALLDEQLSSEGTRAQRILRYRQPGWDVACELWRAFHGAGSSPESERLSRWNAERSALGPAELKPALWLQSADLKAQGIAPGPRWGALLRQAEELQLDGELIDRAAALAWLARQT